MLFYTVLGTTKMHASGFLTSLAVAITTSQASEHKYILQPQKGNLGETHTKNQNLLLTSK